MSNFQCQAAIGKVQTLADAGLRLYVDTQELSPDSKAELFNQQGKVGWFLFSPQVMKQEDVPDIKVDIEAGEKSPSARLRSALYIYHKENGVKIPFEDFYKKEINKIIEAVKEKI